MKLVGGNAVHALPIAGHRQAARALEHALPVLHILRDVENHRSRPPGPGDLEGRAYGSLEFGRVGDEENMLGNRAHDARDRRFLERIGADRAGRDLAANHHDRYGVRHAIANRRDHVRGAGARGDERDANLAAGAGEACSHESGALLVGRDDQRHRGIVLFVVQKHGIVNGQNGPAAVAENGVHTLVRQDLHEHFGARHAGAGERVGALVHHVVTIFHPPKPSRPGSGAQVPSPVS